MRFLIDTHVAIWLLNGDRELDQRVAELLEDPKNEIFISAASIWEAEIKKASGRLPWPDDALARLDADGIGIVEMLTVDAVAAARLPAHHGDPFDRMIVAQARRLDLTLVTRDRNIRKYDVRIQLA